MRLLFSLSAAVVLAVLALAACNSTENRGNSPGNSTAKTTTSQSPSSGHIAPPDGVKRVTTVELREALDKGTALVVDVRGDAAYKQNHIKGSISVPSDQVAQHLKELPRDKMIVTYCS
jgi:3-mercaptopyruvate sulfurtransferase SseA